MAKEFGGFSFEVVSKFKWNVYLEYLVVMRMSSFKMLSLKYLK